MITPERFAVGAVVTAIAGPIAGAAVIAAAAATSTGAEAVREVMDDAAAIRRARSKQRRRS